MLETLLVLAGLGQIALFAASFAIPRVMRWSEDLARVRPILRQMFWNYAAYILFTNLAIGLVSGLAPEWLLDGSPLATAVTGYVAVYWGARVAVQFLYFDRTEAAASRWHQAAEFVLVLFFVFLTLVYGAIATRPWWGTPA